MSVYKSIGTFFRFNARLTWRDARITALLKAMLYYMPCPSAFMYQALREGECNI